ncbi:MAG: ferrochelatase [Gammaproteobacteria bacterium]|nr:ferrochelatase [Gammaproteobacteria bacterium]MDH5801835.1 ferrochelatase [Gammaproteobacteria bacterium]
MDSTNIKIEDNQEFDHKTQLTTGILLVNLGTPESPTASALRRYLAEFLWDPRIVDLPRWLWWFILKVILLIRPRRSAAAYKKIWTEAGSPLLVISQRQKEVIERSLSSLYTGPIVVELGMRYGNPSIAYALQRLRQAHAQRVLVLPLYPQYSCSTTASTFDAVAAAVKNWRWVPELRMVNSYHDFPPYIEALANSIKESWGANGQAQMLLFSFHGTPMRFLETGDPYHCMCQTTARLVAERLGLVESRWQVTFQSIFGREKWLQPYTINTLETLAHSGVRSVDVVCPGFSADCLETLEEIQEENCHAFLNAGGKEFRYIPALNDRVDHVHALCSLIQMHTLGWLDTAERWDAQVHQQANVDRAERAKALGAKK